jgi:hypothetical protein
MPLSKRINADYVPPNLSNMEEVTYCLNCVDQTSGKIGSFVFDEALYESTGAHFAITEVFLTIDGLLDYLRGEGFIEHPRDVMLTVRRAKK